MNALVSFRANAVGNLSATREERQAAAEKISANLRASSFPKAGGAAKSVGAKSASAAKTNMSTSDAAPPVMGDELDRDAFLQLLVLQLKNQDPTEPMDNNEMIAQLAQFSALEASTNLNTNFETFNEEFEVFAGNMDQLNFISAQGLLGNYVEGIGADGAPVTGLVDSVHLEGSIVVLMVDGAPLPMTGVVGVAPDDFNAAGGK